MPVLFSKSGPFTIPEEVELQLFRQCPPHTPEGATLFQKQNASKFNEDLKTLQTSEILHWGYLILDRRPVCEGYQQLKVRTIYSYPLLTTDPDAVEAAEISFWSTFLQNEAGDIFSHDLEDSEDIRNCEALHILLKDGGYMSQFGLQDIPEGATWEIVELEDESEEVLIRWQIQRILEDLLKAVDSSRLPGDCLAITRDLVEGRVGVTDIVPE